MPAPAPLPVEPLFAPVLAAGAAELPRHPVWHIRAYYAARARRFTGRRALDQAKARLYHLLATTGDDQWCDDEP